MAGTSRRACALGLAATVLVGCVVERRSGLGEQCELASECDAPLVCRLGHCRRECRTSRDCPGGDCVAGPKGLGVCQLREETRCALATDCPSPLVCRFGGCVNECALEGSTRDCPPGAVCRRDAEGLGCVQEASGACQTDRDCASAGPDGGPLMCAFDGTCRPACRVDRDCVDGTVCWDGRCVFAMDAGAPDAGPPPDAGGGDDGGLPVVANAHQVAAGASHTCAILGLGRQPYCWGDDPDGRIGTGTISFAPVTLPARVQDFGGEVAFIAAGTAHACLARALGQVTCWGSNGAGALSSDSLDPLPSPNPVFGVSSPTALALGDQLSCALEGAGTVRCWGDNTFGQLGTAPSGFSISPVESSVATDASVLVAGDAHHCALHGTGVVDCVGSDARGQLGAAGPSVTDAIDVAAGRAHSCLVRAGGEVRCWGAGDQGQLGLGDTADASARTVVPGVPAAAQVAAGGDHTCALTAGGEVWCWGDGDDGQSVPGQASDALSPQRVEGLSGVTALSLGARHSCALVGAAPNAEIHCWGANDRGQLGVGDTEPRAGIERVRISR